MTKANIIHKPWKYKMLLGAYVALLLVSLLSRTFTGGLEWLTKNGFYNADFVSFMLIAVFAFSLRNVRAGFIGGIAVFNQPSMEIGSGLYLIVPGSELGVLPLHEQNDQFPADPDLISKRPDTSPLMPGEVRPIRIMTGPPEAADEYEVLGERTAPEFTFSVRWRVHEKGFFELALNLPGGTDWKNKLFHVRKYMRDTAEGLLNLEVTSRSPAKVVAEQRKIGVELKTALETAFKRYALEIVEVLLQSPDFGDGINHALARVIEARGEAKETRTKADGKSYETAKLSEGAATAAVNAAEAEKVRLRLVSEGQKEADLNAAIGREAALAAEGTGRKKAAEALDMEGAHYMALEQAPEILGDKTVIVGAEGVAQALGIGSAVQAATKPPASQKGGTAK